MSLWSELYPVVSADDRFHQMLGQPGSTPLDLLKFYVDDLKSRFHDDKRVIKEICKERNIEVDVGMSFEQFSAAVFEDKRAAEVDSGNMKLAYGAVSRSFSDKA